MEAGTHPGSGQVYQRLFWTSPSWREGDSDDQRWELKTAYGLTARRAVLPEVSVDGAGRMAAALRLKQRIWQQDTGPIDTWRASLQAGMGWRDGRDPGPRAGVVSTWIRQRHGFNVQVEWYGELPADSRFELNASYLYRMHPAVYGPRTPGAWYVMAESLNRFDGSGNVLPDAAVGLLYEARRWAAEAAVRGDSIDRGLDARSTRLGLGLRALW